MAQMLNGKYIRGPRIMVDGLCREELENSGILSAYAVTIREREFEAEDFQTGIERVLRNQEHYNDRTKDASQDAIRWIEVWDGRGHTWDLWDRS